MASPSVPSTLRFCTNFTPFLGVTKISHEFGPRMKLRHANLSQSISQPIHLIRAAHDLGPQEEHRALETVLKLYEAIKNRNANQLSETIAEECSCVSNFVSAFQPYLGKKQVMAFFSSLMKYLGNNIEIVVQRTLDEGMVVGVSWKLEWKKVPLHLGKGFSFYTCHVYQGKVMIRNVEMFLEPILHMEPLRLELIALAMAAVDKLNPQLMLKKRERKVIIILFILLFVAALVCSFK
ncbi:uncharacterized protein LOC130985876 [Salvia miltiorrhiza]|uniref:uncharacterized protein LOC130985876 n=1 Tax=Salvia miltiorrhiza TaxID=226208 RepID=UPI0025ACBE00|nr:uncharacterized protein LOC130985876 [Salvia miltiorrhiza]